ncbi:hypothetical protein N7478_005667 [Penicillium angulare]|uniref:uncharacterized protein n=1 Tax=Penicillium angulare TaxID=116970 RepID=UPI002540B8B3|nr:uncharacterized protein N7478_005667 [Penicillium angulare]KAJ5280295.1 hypothetical protein N7478_005667 [Penicillium angulare]
MADEQTFIAIKPDGVQRGLVGPIISRFENRGFKLVALKLTSPGQELLEKHYADLATKPFFKGLVSSAPSAPWSGRVRTPSRPAVSSWVLPTPLTPPPGTIRGDYAIEVGRNVCHGSDSVENAKKEIALWFTPSEVLKWTSAQAKWVYE